MFCFLRRWCALCSPVYWALVIRQDDIDWQQTDLITYSAGEAASTSAAQWGLEQGKSCLGLVPLLQRLIGSEIWFILTINDP